MIQIGQPEEGSEEKPEYASVPRNMNIATITLEESLELFKLPRVLGQMDGEDLKASLGRFGPYVQLGKLYASMPKKFEEDEEAYDPFSITFEQGEILMKAKQVAEANKYIHQFESGIDELPEEVEEKGTVLIFPSFYKHQVNPVTSGTRHSLVTWVEGPHWR